MSSDECISDTEDREEPKPDQKVPGAKHIDHIKESLGALAVDSFDLG